MWNEPTKEELAKLPPICATEDIPVADKIVRMHFFIGACDWWAVEYGPEDQIFFGFANLGDPQCAEWGYVSLAELRDCEVPALADGSKLNGSFEVDRDLHWDPRPAKDVKGIVDCNGV